MNYDLIIFTNEQQFSPEVFIIAGSMRHLQYLTHGTDNVFYISDKNISHTRKASSDIGGGLYFWLKENSVPLQWWSV